MQIAYLINHYPAVSSGMRSTSTALLANNLTRFLPSS
jgi:hypothetical protein